MKPREVAKHYKEITLSSLANWLELARDNGGSRRMVEGLCDVIEKAIDIPVWEDAPQKGRRK